MDVKFTWGPGPGQDHGAPCGPDPIQGMWAAAVAAIAVWSLVGVQGVVVAGAEEGEGPVPGRAEAAVGSAGPSGS